MYFRMYFRRRPNTDERSPYFCIGALFVIAIIGLLSCNDPPPPAEAPGTITNSIGMKLVRIEPGEFLMGSPANEPDRGDDETQHRVRLTKAFFLGTTEVTQAQWRAVMGTTLRQQRDLGDKNFPLSGEGDDYPMYYVSWEEAVEFCRKLSGKEGKRYRLPTEAEWEYACRAGSVFAYCFGDNRAQLGSYAWFGDNSGNGSLDSRRIWDADQANYAKRLTDNGCQTRPVGGKKANDWGLSDMHGNVWEWCADWKGDYPKGESIDPKGANEDTGRVLRGGSWYDNPQFCRSASRYGHAPGNRYTLIGFRVSLDSP